MDLVLAARGKRSLADGSARRLRQELKLPLRVFADALGVTVTTVWHWETGVHSPTPEHAAAYAELLEQLRPELESA